MVTFVADYGKIIGVKSGDCELSKVSITACLTVRLSVEMDYHHLTPSLHDLTLFFLEAVVAVWRPTLPSESLGYCC